MEPPTYPPPSPFTQSFAPIKLPPPSRSQSSTSSSPIARPPPSPFLACPSQMEVTYRFMPTVQNTAHRDQM